MHAEVRIEIEQLKVNFSTSGLERERKEPDTTNAGVRRQGERGVSCPCYIAGDFRHLSISLSLLSAQHLKANTSTCGVRAPQHSQHTDDDMLSRFVAPTRSLQHYKYSLPAVSHILASMGHSGIHVVDRAIPPISDLNGAGTAVHRTKLAVECSACKHKSSERSKSVFLSCSPCIHYDQNSANGLLHLNS